MEVYFHFKDDESFDKFNIKFYKVNTNNNIKELVLDTNLSKPMEYKKSNDSLANKKVAKIVKSKYHCKYCDCYISNFKQHCKTKKHNNRIYKQ